MVDMVLGDLERFREIEEIEVRRELLGYIELRFMIIRYACSEI